MSSSCRTSCRGSTGARRTSGSYEMLLEVRNDTPQALMAMAEAFRGDRHAAQADVCRTCAVLRYAERGGPVPASVDGALTLRGVSLAYPPHKGFRGVSQLGQALRALGQERATALLRGRLDGSMQDAVRALPVLSAVDDPALVQ